jgi:GNAT superfamily N-acetyltransferase
MSDVKIRPLLEGDLADADRIMRRAFGTFLKLPDPLSFLGDGDFVYTRWRADPAAALAAEQDGRLVGSNFATRWGSVAFFGPISVEPELWDRGVAQQLLQATMKLFAKWRSRHVGLYTFAESGKHVGLYQKFGFYPRFLTLVLEKKPGPVGPPAARFSTLLDAQKRKCIADARRLTGTILPGLDVRREIEAVDAQKLGDTILIPGNRGAGLGGFAVCQYGAGTEAGSGNCYVKFGAVARASGAQQAFERLLDACESYAAERGASLISLGVNAARELALQTVKARGYRTDIQGVVMHLNNDPGYNVRSVFLIDDWR